MKIEFINPEATYSFVLLGDKNNLDGSRDCVVRLLGTELINLLQLIKGASKL